MRNRSSSAALLSREPPPPPTIAPLVMPSIEDLARPPEGLDAKPRKALRRLRWLLFGVVLGVVAGFVAHDRTRAAWPVGWAWCVRTGSSIHDYFSPPRSGVAPPAVPAPVVAASAAKTASAMPSAPPSGAASSPAASARVPTMRFDDLPRAKPP